MKKWSKKLKLAKETIRNLEAGSLENALGGVATGKTFCATQCVTNCPLSACRTTCAACD